MSSNLSVSAAIEQRAQLLNMQVSIDGALVIRSTEAYLVDSTKTPESAQRIPIHCPDLESRLDVAIGGWMGSAYSYIDSVLIKGVLEAGTVRKHKLVLSHIHELTLFRDGEKFTIAFAK